jgi:hypothetical protein
MRLFITAALAAFALFAPAHAAESVVIAGCNTSAALTELEHGHESGLCSAFLKRALPASSKDAAVCIRGVRFYLSEHADLSLVENDGVQPGMKYPESCET